MKLAYEIEIKPVEIETLVKVITNLVKEFLNEVKKEEESFPFDNTPGYACGK